MKGKLQHSCTRKQASIKEKNINHIFGTFLDAFCSAWLVSREEFCLFTVRHVVGFCGLVFWDLINQRDPFMQTKNEMQPKKGL